jgi:putative inorganic carbon (HCO3(-)) transporter
LISQLLDRRHVWLVTALVAAPLMFPLARPGITVAALVGAALLSAGVWLTDPHPVRSPLNWPMILLLVAVSAAAWLSPWRSDAFEKWTGVALGMMVVQSALYSAIDERRIWFGVALNLLLGFGLIAVGAVSTNWIDKLQYLSAFARSLPRLNLVQGADGVQPNVLGGTVLLVLPLVVALAGNTWKRDVGPSLPGASVIVAMIRASLVALVILLLLTQSRTSWVSAIVTLFAMVAIYRRAVWWLLLPAGAVVLAMVVAVSGNPDAVATQEPGAAALSLASRYEVWARALQAIRDVPVTGFGLNAFHHVARDWYPLLLLPAEMDITHAHNLFLQVALDGGVATLVCYLSLLLVAACLAWQILARGAPRHRVAAIGLLGNLIAAHIFGLTDAIALGAKVGVLMWFSIGLLGALHRLVCAPRVPALSRHAG